MSYTYDTVSWEVFTDSLLTTYDLDPIYVILTSTTMPESMIKKWMLAYWCYYSSGVASYIAEKPDFYSAMRERFSGENQYPRGHERRHFRGSAGIEAINYLETFGSPERIIDYIYGGNLDYQSVATRAMKFKLFGPWIAWKIGDMGERVLRLPVNFDDADLYMYKDPVQGCALYLYDDYTHPITREEVGEVVEDMLFRLSKYKAPPYLDRPLNVQEAETCACKYKAHIKLQYPLSFDLDEIRHALKTWSKESDLASELLIHLPDGITKYQ